MHPVKLALPRKYAKLFDDQLGIECAIRLHAPNRIKGEYTTDSPYDVVHVQTIHVSGWHLMVRTLGFDRGRISIPKNQADLRMPRDNPRRAGRPDGATTYPVQLALRFGPAPMAVKWQHFRNESVTPDMHYYGVS